MIINSTDPKKSVIPETCNPIPRGSAAYIENVTARKLRHAAAKEIIETSNIDYDKLFQLLGLAKPIDNVFVWD